ncbi:unnamed protein product [Peniophora sp. CBMAI 1063]|nr:unnamed protein product [Peniophora sp. CBMAI 1063]
MAPIRNACVRYVGPPEGYVEPDVHVKYDGTRTIELDDAELNGGFILKTLCLSIDPYMRGRMCKPETVLYFGAFEPGRPLSGYGVGQVVRSEDPAFRPGEVVHGWMSHEEYSVYSCRSITIMPFRKIADVGVPWSVYTGILGVPGQTAFYAWKAYSQSRPGECAFISTAAGAVGSLVVQLAKRDGLRVIASSGTEDKRAFALQCGADVSFNYKNEKVADVLAREAKGIDIYFDNVGGEHLETALAYSNHAGRFIECGMASLYNGQRPHHVENLQLIIIREITLQGVFCHSPRFRAQYEDEFYSVITQMVKDGTLKYREHISYGLETVGHALRDVGMGTNVGKRVVVLDSSTP